jgi:MFS family permease
MAVFSLAIAGTVMLRGSGALAALSATQGVAMGVSMVAVGAALGEATIPANRGIAMGGFGTAIYTGMAVSSWILGRLILHGGYRAGFFTAGAIGIAGSAVSLFLLSASPGGRPMAVRVAEEQEER